MKGLHRGVYLLPNLFTSANLFLGFFAIIRGIQISLRGGNDYRSCAFAIIAAALFDMMDGRVARRTNTATKFGVEYDSLSDLVSFGVAPAILLYMWAFQDLGRIGWLGAFLYIACGALRLARFNLQVTGVERKFYQGLPIPMAAMMMAGSILIWQGRIVSQADLFFVGDATFYLLVLTYTLAGLMISTIPYRSLKSLSLTSRQPFYYLFFVVLAVMIWGAKPWWFLFLLGCVYLLSGPVEHYILPKPVKALQKVKKRRRVRRALNRIDRISSQPPSQRKEKEQIEQPISVEKDNIHPIKRS